MSTFLGIDTGGTFTDFVLVDPQGLRMHKGLSTPAAPNRPAILGGIAALGLEPQQCGASLVIMHGSTVAMNAVLEGKGARTAFVTNRGFRDLLTIGRQARAELYNLQPLPQTPPVPEELCLETGGRLGAQGEIVDPLSAADIAAVGAQLAALVPAAAGALSALGMLAVEPGRQCSLRRRARLSDLDAATLSAAGVAPADLLIGLSIDLCYEGQSSALNLGWLGVDKLTEAFHVAYAKRYGHPLDVPVQMVALRVRLQAPAPAVELPRQRARAAAAPCGQSAVHGIGQPVPVWQRADLALAVSLPGAAIVIEPISTTWVAPGWQAGLDEFSHLLLSKADCVPRAESAKMRVDLV